MDTVDNIMDTLDKTESLLASRSSTSVNSKGLEIPVGQHTIDLGIVAMLINISDDKVEMIKYINQYFAVQSFKKAEREHTNAK